MKFALSILALCAALSAHSAELQLQECKYKNTIVDFTPSSALTAMLSKEVRGAIVYKVKYTRGRNVVGSKTELAVIDELSGKNLEVTFFEHDEAKGVVYNGNAISIDLKSPVSLDAPMIYFSGNQNDSKNSRVKCGFIL